MFEPLIKIHEAEAFAKQNTPTKIHKNWWNLEKYLEHNLKFWDLYNSLFMSKQTIQEKVRCSVQTTICWHFRFHERNKLAERHGDSIWGPSSHNRFLQTQLQRKHALRRWKLWKPLKELKLEIADTPFPNKLYLSSGVCVCVCVCVSETHSYPGTVSIFGDTF